MNLFRTTAVALALTTGLLTLPAHANAAPQNVSGDPVYQVETPKAFAMTADLLIARPLLIAATVIGTGLFVVTLPFSAGGGNVKEAANAFIVEPGEAAFVRCLGCTTSGYQK